MQLRGFLAFGMFWVILGGIAGAADKANPSGIWKWTMTREDNVVVEFSLKLKYEEDKLTGTVTLPNKQKVDIEDASFKEGEVAFTVKRPAPMGQTITIKYKGKQNGDVIKGTRETDFKRASEPKGEWEAKREKA